VCPPSASAAGPTNGEAQDWAAPPSIRQEKATGRLALNSIVGRRSRRGCLGDRDHRRQGQNRERRPGIDQAGADGSGAEGADRPRRRRQRGPQQSRRDGGIRLTQQGRHRGGMGSGGRGAAETPGPFAALEGSEEGGDAAIGRREIGLGDCLRRDRRRRGFALDRAEVVGDRAT
jgi:hypothetical protein